jgi:Rhodopirellula transposase DDE domain
MDASFFNLSFRRVGWQDVLMDADFVGRMGPQLELLLPLLDEKSRRLVLGAVARAAGEGGVTAVAAATGAGRQTVADGAADLASGDVPPPGRSRRPGGGRKRLEDHDPQLRAAMLGLLEEPSRGDPMVLLLWTTLPVRDIARELTRQGHPCGRGAVLRMLHAEGLSTQGNSRTIEGRRHPDRDAQFRYIDATAKEYLAAGDPVISVDAKKKEQVGQYATAGRCRRPAGDPVRVRDHDFPDDEKGKPDEEKGKVAPYGIYDIADNPGFVNVGTDHDTAAFAVESIRRWWQRCGRDRYPGARRLLVTCDAGGSNGYRTRAWKAELAAFAARAGLEVTVPRFPPGTSKWNKIKHRLFSQATRTWRARPPASHQVILSANAATTTSTALKVTAALDPGRYPTGTEVSDTAMKDIEDRYLTRHAFHGDWNHAISPAPRAPAPPPAPAPRPGPGHPGRPRHHRHPPPGPGRPGHRARGPLRRLPRAAAPPNPRRPPPQGLRPRRPVQAHPGRLPPGRRLPLPPRHDLPAHRHPARHRPLPHQHRHPRDRRPARQRRHPAHPRPAPPPHPQRPAPPRRSNRNHPPRTPHRQPTPHQTSTLTTPDTPQTRLN